MNAAALRHPLERRSWQALALFGVLVAAPPLLFGHRGLHATMSLVVPGAGLAGSHQVAAVTFGGVAVVATWCWLRWGIDWALPLVTVTAMILSGALAAPDDVATAAISRGAHEFPLVIVVIAVLGWTRTAFRRVPVVRRLVARRHRRPPSDLRLVAPVMRCRVAALCAVAGASDGALGDAVDRDDVRRRARRIGFVARARRGGDPLRVDHAHARAALALCDRLDLDQRRRLHADASRSWAGVPCSEPGWIRPLDGTLAAIAVADPVLTARWVAVLHTTLGLRRGRRPAWVWAPLGLAAGRSPDWEHAAVTALGYSAGWLDDDEDWTALRRRALGAAARGVADPDDERLVAASRCWLALVDDPAAAAVLARPTVRHDPLAIALDALSERLVHDRTRHAPCVVDREGH